MADQKKVVFEYIEALLVDSDSDSEMADLTDEIAAGIPDDAVESEPEPGRGASGLSEDSEASEVELEIEFTAPKASAEPEPEPEPEPDLINAAPSSMAAASPASKAPSRELNCVLLDMHGLKLAVDFDRIEGALNMRDLSLAIGGMPDWILGSFGEVQAVTHVVDTALWLIPERYKPEHSQYSEVLILQGRKWALACDGLVKSLRVPMDKINLNTDKAQRSWLLGTYMEERCAIIDVDHLVEAFEATIA